MGNASSSEQQQQQQQQQGGGGGGGGGGHGHHHLNPLARPRSHGGAVSHGSSSSSSSSSSSQAPITQAHSHHGAAGTTRSSSTAPWTRHGSLRRGPSHASLLSHGHGSGSSGGTGTPQRAPFFGGGPLPGSERPAHPHPHPSRTLSSSSAAAAHRSLSSSSTATATGRNRRSGSVSASTPSTVRRGVGAAAHGGPPDLDLTEAADDLTPTPSRERAATTSAGTSSATAPASPTTPRQHSTSSGRTTAAAAAALLRRPSRFGSRNHRRSIDLQDVETGPSSPPPPAPMTGTLSPTTLSPSAFAPHAIISPFPSPSIATDQRHASGTTSYVSPTDTAAATTPAATPQTVPPSPGGTTATASSSRPFGRGVAAIFANPNTPGQSLGSTAAASLANNGGSGAQSPTFTATTPQSMSMSLSRDGAGPGDSSFSTATDALGRHLSAALPSYLKIPTLIPSKQQQPLLPPSSLPSSPGAASASSAPGSGNVTPGSSGWSAVAGTAGRASDAVLTTEDVVIAPGDASKVSSPSEEEEQEGRQLAVEDSGDRGEGVEEAGERSPQPAATTTSLSRTPTPTQKYHAAKALTPARERDPSPHAARNKVHVATGLASGATTPVMPIPPGLTSAPPSAVTPMVTHDDDGRVPTPPTTTATPLAPADSPGAGATGGGGGSTPKSKYPAQLAPYYYRNASSSSTMGAGAGTGSGAAAPHATAGTISLMPIVLTWRGGGKEVFVTGTFANEWRSKILLKRSAGGSVPGATSSSSGRRMAGPKEEHTVVLHLPPGTHRMKFIVDDRWRVSRELPTATDGDGNLVNYLEIPNVGPAHPGPLSAPGEDLIMDEGERERERRRERNVERIKEAERAGRSRPRSNASRSRHASGSEGVDAAPSPVPAEGDASAGTTADAAAEPSPPTTPIAEVPQAPAPAEPTDPSAAATPHRTVLALREEARRAALLRQGQLEEVFGPSSDGMDDLEALRAAENWVREVPDVVLSAHVAEIEAEGDGDGEHGGEHDGEDAGDKSERHATSAPPPPPPPSLPRQLEKVILNSSPASLQPPAATPHYGGTGTGTGTTSASATAPPPPVDDNSILPAPNHVVLNHLTASAIKGGVLAVGTTTRYKRKYVTTVFYRPVLS